MLKTIVPTGLSTHANGLVGSSLGKRLVAHLQAPLFRNAYALLLSGIASSGLGMVYWMLAARLYSPKIVGINSVAIAVMMLLSGISQMSMNSALIRFIPQMGSWTKQLILICYGVSVTVAMVVGLVYLAGLSYWTPVLVPYLSQPLNALIFIGATASWSIYALQDSVLAGLRQSIWVPVENILGALLKIGLLLLLLTVLPVYGIFSAWLLPVLLSNLPVNYFIFRWFLPKHVQQSTAVVPPSVATISRYVLGNYVGTLGYLGYTTLLPILVTALVGPSANAYFYMAWMLAAALQLVANNLTTSLTVEGAWEETKFHGYCFHVLKQAFMLVTPLVVLFLVGAPWLLQIFGADYAQEGTPLLRLLALSALPNVIVMLQLSIARVRNKTYTVIWVQGVLCLSLVGLSYALLPRFGIVGVGWAALIAQSTVAALALAIDMRSFVHQGWHLLLTHCKEMSV